MYEIGDLLHLLPALDTIKTSKKVSVKGDEREVVEYLDIPLCFDIEAYSFLEGEEKRACMWAWGLSIRDMCFMGRTWGEFLDALEVLVQEWEICPNHRLIIWVHNLSYDFQFFRKWLSLENVFALDSRTVCYALTKEGIEFRCSYILTGKSCEGLGKSLYKHTLRKLVGTIDYDEARHPGTILTSAEIDYLEADCLVVSAYIEEQIETEGGISHIPLTHTGYCRRFVRKSCFRDTTKKAKYDTQGRRYREFISGLTMDSFVYESCKRAFQGGFTHANPQHSGCTMDNVTSLDVVSDYPAQILANLYPVTPPEYISGFDSISTFEEEIQTGCSIFTIELLDVEPLINYDHYISRSHCIIEDESTLQLDNGRVVRCSHLITTICNIDYFIIKRCYKYKIKAVSGFIKWGWGYLPKPIIQSTLYLYGQKSVLKGNPEQKAEYDLIKALLNSIYGMMVTDPLRPNIPYDVTTHAWGEEVDGTIRFKVPLSPEESRKALTHYNDDYQRFTYYPWGVFITAYARHMLWSGILEFKDDYIYSDTDSIKCKNIDKHNDFVDKYNNYMTGKIHACLDYYGLEHDKAFRMGTWDREDIIPGTNYTYTRFKTLGAKRYMVETPDGLKITISGVKKSDGVAYIEQESKSQGIDPFDFFVDGMTIPPGHAGKLIPYYGDEEISGSIYDRDGLEYNYHELSYIHLSPGGYTMGLSEKYVEYIELLQKGYL